MGAENIKTLWIHPDNGVYYFRKAVPDRLRATLGKTMVKISLGTKDARVAARKHSTVAEQVAATWKAAASPRPLSEEDAFAELSLGKKDSVALAGELYRECLKAHDDANEPWTHWEAEIARLQPGLSARERQPVAMRGNFGGDYGRSFLVVHLAGDKVDDLLRRKAIRLSAPDRRRLCNHAVSALAQAYGVLKRRSLGDYSPDPLAGRFPPEVNFKHWRTWYRDYCDTNLPEPSSEKRKSGVLGAFFRFVGHDIPSRVTEADAVAWMEKRLREVSHDTVRKADLAHPRSFFGWCKKTKRLAANPFADVHVSKSAANKRRDEDGKAQVLKGKRGYDRQEAVRVLRATLIPPGPRISRHGAAARRWVPWLCAYTGARVGEIAQLRRQDVYLSPSEDGSVMVWVVLITPEAGRVKDYDEREVALHPHLLEQGFLDFASASPTETLFYDPARARGGSVANPQSGKVGEALCRWIRETVGITDTTIAPNHAWRHRFRSLLKGKVDPEVLNGIDGHAARTEGEEYGKVYPEVSLAAVMQLPVIRFEDLDAGRGEANQVQKPDFSKEYRETIAGPI